MAAANNPTSTWSMLTAGTCTRWRSLLEPRSSPLTGDRTTTSRPARVTAVIVSWNTRDLLLGCLNSLRDHPASGSTLDIIVVDNGSTDGSAEMVRRYWPDV